MLKFEKFRGMDESNGSMDGSVVRRSSLVVLLLLLVIITFPTPASQAQVVLQRPMILPLAGVPGPSTWLMGQPYGNTVGSFNSGQDQYEAGQSMHFGIDLPAPCGTPVLAAADGEVAFVDNLNNGAGPHNVILRHPQLQVNTLYGHLLERSTIIQGQPVRQGDVIGRSGDPDATCVSRPHLHFEVRAPDMRTAYNPIVYIEAPWHMLASIGGFGYPLFQQDLMAPRRWLSLEDQPDIQFGGRRLNNYVFTWPLPNDLEPLDNTPPLTDLPPLPATTRWQLRKISSGNCCARFWWHPTDPGRLFVIDGVEGQVANIVEWDVQNGDALMLWGQAPPPWRSPDGTHEIQVSNGQFFIHDILNSNFWPINTSGILPTISPGNRALLWPLRTGRSIPGSSPRPTAYWTSALDGSTPRIITEQRGGSAWWIDDNRILVSSRLENSQSQTYSVFDLRDDASYTLGVWERVRGVRVSPGGQYLIFYLTFQPDPLQDGMYIIRTEPGAVAENLPWFGGYQWRDADSLYYLPFDPTTTRQTLAYYEVSSRETRLLTDPISQPFTVANGEWAVSADGRQIVFQSADDFGLWILEAIE